MKCELRNGFIYENGCFVRRDVSFEIAADVSKDAVVFDSLYLLPGLADVHVHFREPGFSYKETIATGSRAAARGGYTAVCTMPNLKPAPDCMANLKPQLDAIAKDAVIGVLPYGTITVEQKGEMLADMEAMAPYVIGFSDDGRGVQDRELMKAAMLKAKSLGKMIVAHCEDNSLLRGGYIHDGEYAKAHGHKGICSESEWGPIARDLELVRETGCAYHVCHISTKESVEIIRRAKREGLDVTCETGPHYLLKNDSMLQEHGRFKMNPPIRGKEDQEALIEGIIDGTIDMIATDHAPHSAEEKEKGLAGSLMGVVGIETAFATMYKGLVLPGVITLEKLVGIMHTAPCRRFGIKPEGFTLFDLNAEYRVDPSEFVSMGKYTPFEGETVQGRCVLTVCNGRAAWIDEKYC